MLTTRSLTVSPYLVVSHACPPWEQPCMPPRATLHASPGATMHAPSEQPCMPPRATMHAPPEQPCTPPWATMHAPPRATTHAPSSPSNHACTPRSNHACPPWSNQACPLEQPRTPPSLWTEWHNLRKLRLRAVITVASLLTNELDCIKHWRRSAMDLGFLRWTPTIILPNFPKNT